MSTDITFNKEGREKLKKGIDKVANAVKVTLGGAGRNVVIDGFPFPHVTKDGVTVAESIELEDSIEDMGARLIKQVARKTANDSGDGTSSTCVLAQGIIKNGLEAVKNGANPIEIKKGIDKAVNEIIKVLQTKSQDISANYEILKQVATISANGDDEIGHIVADVVSKVKLEGQVTVEDSLTGQTYTDIVEGTKVMSGYINPYHITNQDKMRAEYKDAVVFLYDGDLTTHIQIKPIMEAYDKLQTNAPMVIFASGLDGEARSFFTINKVKGQLQSLPIRLNGTPFDKGEVLKDIQSVTGGSIIQEKTGLMLKDFTPEMFGKLDMIISDEEKTIITRADNKIQERVEQLKEQLKEFDDNLIKQALLKGRIARLTGGVAVIYIGGKTDAEIREKKDRVDDAVGATMAAIEEGVIAGGGVALFRAKSLVPKIDLSNKDQKIGWNIVFKSLDAPIKQILTNGGYYDKKVLGIFNTGKQREVLNAISNNPFNFGFDIKKEVLCDMVEKGIIDPFKVVRNSLENSASIAGLILTTESVINKGK